MKGFMAFFCILFGLQSTVNVNALVEDVIDILYLGREVVKTISTTWELVDKAGITNEIELPFLKRKDKKILSRMAELSESFKKTEMTVSFICNKDVSDNVIKYLKVYESSEVTVQGLESYIRSNTKLELVIHEMIDLVSRVNLIHDQYVEYVEHYDQIERETLENFAQSVINDGSLSVKGMLPRIQSLWSGPRSNDFRVLGNRGLLELIATDLQVNYC